MKKEVKAKQAVVDIGEEKATLYSLPSIQMRMDIAGSVNYVN